jgi:hypothetical protein
MHVLRVLAHVTAGSVGFIFHRSFALLLVYKSNVNDHTLILLRPLIILANTRRFPQILQEEKT